MNFWCSGIQPASEKKARKELEGRLDALLKSGNPKPVLERASDEEIAEVAQRKKVA